MSGKPHGLSAFQAAMLDKPSVADMPNCAICGRPAGDAHHVIQKGMGGVSRELERRIPKMRLCGSGNLDGHHGRVHQRLTHVYWDDDRGGWVYYNSPEPMNDFECWRLHRDEYLPVPGWVFQRDGGLPGWTP